MNRLRLGLQLFTLLVLGGSWVKAQVSFGLLDCNGNGIVDSCDTSCGFVGGACDLPGCGRSPDCNANMIPDECEAYPTVPIGTIRVASGLDNPVFVTAPPGDTSRLFIVEQTGRIKILNLGTGLVLGTPFLNLAGLITTGGERGLLGLAFHPNYAVNGFFFVNYTNLSGNTVIARYTVSANPNVANAASALGIKTIAQPFSNHNGGWLGFGPDGMLYCGMGDGGSANDPPGNGQNTGTLLGKILRLNVDVASPYVPADNPFVGPGNPLDEIWAIGMRNPWRPSFDRLTGDLYLADVGQNAWEEISYQPASSAGGENYGWRCMEGNHCTGLSGCVCMDASLTDPIYEYSHGSGCSITGGYVYRGCAIPELSGTYFFSDFCTNFVRTFRYDGANLTDFQDRTAALTPPAGQGSLVSISSYGEDAEGELYIVSLAGNVYKIVPLCSCQLYGDVVPAHCVVDIDDISCILDGFVENTTLPCTVDAADIEPCGGGDGDVDIDDILSGLDSFAGIYACPHPCEP